MKFVSLTTDFVPGTASAHSAMVSPGSVTPLHPHLENFTLMVWQPGFELGQNQFTEKVTHKGSCITQNGHNVGYMIPHVTWPLNPQLALHTGFSARKVVFGAAAITADKKPLGSAVVDFITICSSPCAHPISLKAITGYFNSVLFGMSITDEVEGYIEYGTNAAAEIVCFLMSGGMADSKSTFLKDTAMKFLSNPIEQLVKGAASITNGAVDYARTGEGSASFNSGSDVAGKKYTITANDDGIQLKKSVFYPGSKNDQSYDLIPWKKSPPVDNGKALSVGDLVTL